MSSGSRFYRIIEDTLARTIAGDGGFSEYVQIAPVVLPSYIYEERRSRLAHLHAFFSRTLEIFKEVIKGHLSPLLSSLLLNDAPQCYRYRFHNDLPTATWTIPIFFRTDESKSGKIFEIQCPGSGWGDLELLSNVYENDRSSSTSDRYKPSNVISKEILDICKKDHPSVLHLLDNSSNPVSMRFLIATTQPPLRYWGYERSVHLGECDFIRSHSFYGLVAENLFKDRLRQASEGSVKFDLPPLLIFDEKIPLTLPFFEETCDLFSDDIRRILTHSYPVQESGFRDVDGAWVTITEFLKRPPSRRRYFLKYGGSDVSINWGSRAVFRLNDGKAETHMKHAVADARRNRFWLIQPEISEKEHVEYFDKVTDAVLDEEMHSKYSCFYGPQQLVGMRTMHRPHFKVHGQENTVIGLVLPDSLITLGVNSERS
jgi:hypothetical protein